MRTTDPDHFFGDERTKRLDMEVIPVVQAETDWTIYDGYHITEPLAYNRKFFVDPIHHPGRLTELGWQFILGYFCQNAPSTNA